jgi:hypothetical protein
VARRRGIKSWLAYAVAAFVVLAVAAAIIWREDIFQTTLDPKTPFQTYDPPAAPNYASDQAWALIPHNPGRPAADEPPVDIFFIYPTTYNGGHDWNGPIDNAQTSRDLARVMLPNYAGPFVRLGRVFAPRYRQASLYAQITLRDDSRDARRFAYGDIQTAFRYWREHHGGERPFIIAAVDQGGFLASRLLAEEVAPDASLRSRLVGAYLVDTIVPADLFAPGSSIPACQHRDQAGCVVAYAEAPQGDAMRGEEMLQRTQVWTADGDLENIGKRPALCVNPLLGGVSDAEAPARLNLGAVNATGLELTARPAFMQRQVSAKCEGGLLWVSAARSPSLKPDRGWPEHLKASGYNLFYADLEADAADRIKAHAARRPAS